MTFLKHLKDEKLLLLLIFFMFVLLVLNPQSIPSMWHSVDWSTIITLTGLLIISTGIKESNVLDKISIRTLKHVKTEKELSFFMIILSSVFAMFLTNDITLFIVVPLTLSLQSFLKNDIKKIIIFEALAVNVGSTLTPIGNPQNLLLWHLWRISFSGFVLQLLWLEIIMMVVLIIFSMIVFKKSRLKIVERKGAHVNRKLSIISLIFLISYIALLELHVAKFAVALLFIFYIFFYRKILKEVDWFLLIIFILMFVDVHIFSQFNFITNIVKVINMDNPSHVFFLSLVFSQVASNVPAAIFVSKFSKAYLAITYGVNIGGNGFVIGSLANIIALRMTKSRKIYMDFHKYSLVYFAITAILGYQLLAMFHY